MAVSSKTFLLRIWLYHITFCKKARLRVIYNYLFKNYSIFVNRKEDMSKPTRILRSHPNENPSVQKRVEKAIIKHRDAQGGQYVTKKSDNPKRSHGKK